MGRVTKVPLVSLMVMFAAIVPAHAQEGPFTDDEDMGSKGSVSSEGETVVSLFAPGSEAQPAVSVSFDVSGNATVQSNVAGVRVREIVAVADPGDPNFGGACVLTRWVMVPIGQESETVDTYEAVMEFTVRSIYPDAPPDIPACTAGEASEVGDPAPAFEDMLAPFVEQLPRPTPELNPERAITGLDTYLQTHRALAYGPVAGQIDLGGRNFAVSLWAEGVYRVDWGMAGDGDGPAFDEVSGPHAVPGRAYVKGRALDDEAVTHVYTSVPDASLAVSVTDYWVVHYSIEDVVEDATLVAELEPVTVPVEVVQYQAVVIDDG